MMTFQGFNYNQTLQVNIIGNIQALTCNDIPFALAHAICPQ